jgi:hypothetical protein
MTKFLPLLLLGAGALVLLSSGKKVAPPPASVSANVWENRMRALDFLGYDPGEIAGSPTDATRTAIKRFQADYNLEQTGLWDEATAGAVMSAGLNKLREMSWDQLRNLWAAYFPEWTEDPQDDTILFDELFELISEWNPTDQ